MWLVVLPRSNQHLNPTHLLAVTRSSVRLIQSDSELSVDSLRVGGGGFEERAVGGFSGRREINKREGGSSSSTYMKLIRKFIFMLRLKVPLSSCGGPIQKGKLKSIIGPIITAEVTKRLCSLE